MVAIDELTGITEDKREQVIECLDNLLTFRDSQGRLSPIISGYNWYVQLINADRMLTFSTIHETELYKQAMLRDLERLGYNPSDVLKQIREKTGVFLWQPDYGVRDDRGNVLAGLKVKDARTGAYICLQEFAYSLSESPNMVNSYGHLLAEDTGWELNVPFVSKLELLRLVHLFLDKSGLCAYDENGLKLRETNDDKLLRAPWPDAYNTPVLIIGENALKYQKELPYFDQATKLFLIENNNEISFIIHKKLKVIRQLLQYEQLKKLGFCEEKCLANKSFLRYINSIA